MTTYAETVGAPVFNWALILQKDIEDISLSEAEELKKAASGWACCSVGSLCSRIPRHPNGVPKDEELEELGIQFSNDVYEIHYALNAGDRAFAFGFLEEARKTHARIEARAAEILAELPQ